MQHTGYKGSKDEVRALSAYVKLMRATESLSARVHRHLAKASLTISQFGALEALYHLGPLSQAEIAKKVLKSTGNMTMVIDNLEKRGLVSRKRSEVDRRFYEVNLTAAGKELIKSLFPRHAAGIMDEMKVLNSVELVSLANLCRRLGLQITKEGKGGKKHV